MATQTIIVYRNPAEEAMWNVLMSGEMIPVALAGAAFIGTLVLLNRLVEKKFGFRTPQWVTASMFVVSGLVALGVGKYFWIA
jgi:uncharacterized membrane protein YhiD involved in acid resistance